ncbi:MAG: tRNA lysidine(34) synthetase TilS [Spirochaetes bacterium]|nr:tRNA lysidine(34) synthetase TilS [Spirochaetota bacterium]MBU0955126.1 tRNA lysidine(34) synthetase TilS [Spirochaetota bacterium]
MKTVQLWAVFMHLTRAAEMAEADTPLAVLDAFLAAHPALTSLLLAFSAGPDSCALLYAAASLRPKRHLQLSACWIHHGLRPEQEMATEEVLAKCLCQEAGIPLIIRRAAAGSLEAAARQCIDGGVEAAARRFRYTELTKVGQELQADAILTAHTADDTMETMIMRFFTGSGAGGLLGIPEQYNGVYRPFLSLKKQDLLAFVHERGIQYSTDSTNLTEAYLRNKVRNLLIPEISGIFPHFQKALATTADKLRLDDEALNSYADTLLCSDEGRICISRRLYETVPAAVRFRALYRLASPLADRLPWHFLHKALFSEKHDSVLVEGHGISIYCSGEYIKVAKVSEPETACTVYGDVSYSVLVDAPGVFTVGFGLELLVRQNRDGLGIRADAFGLPCIVRSRRPGDQIALKHGRIRLDKWLSESGVPGTLRSLVPVLEDGNGIAAVFAVRFGARDLYRYNDALRQTKSEAFFSIELKGVVSNHAI